MKLYNVGDQRFETDFSTELLKFISEVDDIINFVFERVKDARVLII